MLLCPLLVVLSAHFAVVSVFLHYKKILYETLVQRTKLAQIEIVYFRIFFSTVQFV